MGWGGGGRDRKREREGKERKRERERESVRDQALTPITINRMVHMANGGRFFILFMSIWAIYCGFIYNDFFSFGLDLFGSKSDPGKAMVLGNTYGFGLDPVWKKSGNGLTFTNSYKMKLAVILGFSHMTLGIILAMCNAYCAGDYVTLFAERLPQLVLMVSLIGYM